MSALSPQRHGSLVVRPAAAADAAEIARVQVQSWRETYPGMVPQEHLDSLSEAAHTRHWRRALGTGGPVLVATWEGGVVGLVSGGLSRWREDVTGEIHVLYVLAAAQGKGIGRALFDAAHYALARRGHRGLAVGVLALNLRARRFYEHLGGQIGGETTVSVGGERLREVVYLWPD
ncbi:MAG: GNAT family N-acetyltransferase [Geminicoccaceae bacterium]